MTKCYFWPVLRTQKNFTNLAVPLGTPYLEVSPKKPKLWQVVGLRGPFQGGDCWLRVGPTGQDTIARTGRRV